MQFPRRSPRSTLHQSLPSIQTLFRSSLNDSVTVHSSLLGSTGRVVDGIEVVPLERQNSSTTKICTPGIEEKEAVAGWKEHHKLELAEKPLPSLPGSRWSRVSTKNRLIAILCLQFLMLLTIGLSFMAARAKKFVRHAPSFVQFADPGAPPTAFPIQRGMFSLPIGVPQQQNSACLAQNNESVAWICTARKSLLLSFLPSPAEQRNLTMMFIQPTSNTQPSMYGIQDPEINSLELTPEVDPERPNKGAAYYFRTTYSRTMLLREDQILNQSQDLDPPNTSVSTIQPGDHPWLCVFNETLLEGYIYVSEKSICSNGPGDSKVDNSTITFASPCLPYVMKLTEQWAPSSTHPYCSRMLMSQDGKLVKDSVSKMPTLGGAGPVPPRVVNSTDTNLGQRKRQQTQSLNTCRCQWMVQ